MFCVECGKEGEVYDGLCENCYLAKRKFLDLPKTLDVLVCGECFAVKVGKSWRDALSLDEAIRLSIENAVEKDHDVQVVSLDIEMIEHDTRNYLAKIEAVFRVRGIQGQESLQVEVRLHKGTCQRCSKISGHYFEAVIQLRSTGKNVRQDSILNAKEKIYSRIEELGSQNREIFISKDERQHGGYDLFISSGSAARSIARELTREFGAALKSSSTIIGMRNGEQMKRMTYLVRLPDYLVGDLIVIGEHIYLIRSIVKNTMSLLDLETWNDSSISIKRLPDFELLRREDNVRKATVVTESDTELQLIDPETMKAVEVIKPKGFERKADSVSVVKTNKGIFLLP